MQKPEDEWQVLSLHVMAEVPSVRLKPFYDALEMLLGKRSSANCSLLGEKALIFCGYNVPSEYNYVEFRCCLRPKEDFRLSNEHEK